MENDIDFALRTEMKQNDKASGNGKIEHKVDIEALSVKSVVVTQDDTKNVVDRKGIVENEMDVVSITKGGTLSQSVVEGDSQVLQKSLDIVKEVSRVTSVKDESTAVVRNEIEVVQTSPLGNVPSVQPKAMGENSSSSSHENQTVPDFVNGTDVEIALVNSSKSVIEQVQDRAEIANATKKDEDAVAQVSVVEDEIQVLQASVMHDEIEVAQTLDVKDEIEAVKTSIVKRKNENSKVPGVKKEEAQGIVDLTSDVEEEGLVHSSKDEEEESDDDYSRDSTWVPDMESGEEEEDEDGDDDADGNVNVIDVDGVEEAEKPRKRRRKGNRKRRKKQRRRNSNPKRKS